MKRMLSFILIGLLVLLMAGQALSAAYWKAVTERFPALMTAGETLAVGSTVCIKAADGLVWKADADSATLRPCIGFAYAAAVANGKVAVVTGGQLAGLSALTVGGEVYLSTTAGAYTQSAPTDVQRVGVAISAIAMQIDIGPKNASLGTLADTKIWIGDGTSVPTAYAFSGNATMTNAGVVTVASATGAMTVGGGYGATGATFSTAGVGQFNGDLTTDGALTADSAVIGGGYGATGATISAAGNISGNGNLLVDGTSTLTGALRASVLSTVTEAGAALTVDSTYYGKTIFLTQAGAVAVTLPAAGVAAGSWFRCVNANSDTTAPTYSTPVADNLIAPNNATADSVTFATGHRIGSTVLFISNGSFWMVINESTGCTMTVTDA